MYDDLNNKSDDKGLSSKFDKSARPRLSVDVERYQAYLDGSNMSQAEKEEFLQALWQIIVSFVDLGFGVHPLQEVCGKDAGTVSDTAQAQADAVCLDDPKENHNKDDMRP